MAKHSDLPKILALDTFLGNSDRSPPNLFYDLETDQFCGIDMAASFSTELAKEAYRQIQQIQTMAICLSRVERDALKEYSNTLETLLKMYPPEKQEMLLMKYAKMAGFVENSFFWDQNLKDRIDFHIRSIKSNFEYSKKLLSLLYQVLEID